MKAIIGFFRLIRFLNLVSIALTQFLFQYFIIIPIYNESSARPLMTGTLFFLLCFSSTCIAAAGYIINDYFDLNIDQVNKPGKMVVEKIIKRRWAILWHWILSFTGVAIGFYIGWRTGVNMLGFINMLCVVALWFYSTTFKKQLLVGNIIISILTSWVILVILFMEGSAFLKISEISPGLPLDKILRLSFLYAGFAFIVSLIREVVKDIEDMAGDARYGCRTMPIVWGVHVSKVFVATWLIVVITALVIVQIYVLQFRWWLPAAYCSFLIILPLLYIFRKLFSARSQKDFHILSNWIKFVMLSGIISMVFFKFYS